MRTARRAVAIAVVSLAALAAGLVAAAPAADAAPAQDVPVDTSTHCGGMILTLLDLNGETARSFWTFNPSIFVPPVCEQAVTAACTDPATGMFAPVQGNFTIQPGVQSTATCPPSHPSLVGAFTLVRHA